MWLLGYAIGVDDGDDVPKTTFKQTAALILHRSISISRKKAIVRLFILVLMVILAPIQLILFYQG